MERMIKNFIVAAPIEQDSLLLGLSLVMTIRMAATRDTVTASKGFIEVIVSIFIFLFV
jgi:hypothetical protein